MENKINIAELLKDCPSGMELDCAMYDNCTFDGLEEYLYPIKVQTPDGQISLNKYGCYSSNKHAKCVIFPKGKTTWEGFIAPYKFKDGDVAITYMGDIHLCRTEDSSYCACRMPYERLPKFDSTITTGVKFIRLATEEEKKKLFDAIKENGYKWNPENKTLEKLSKFKVGDKIRHKINNEDIIYEISAVYDDFYGLVDFAFMLDMKYQDLYELVPNKFDITTLVPFDKVLVRSSNAREWVATFYSHYSNNKFYGCGMCCDQCIPYEGNQHLLGTTTDCDEYYKTWEE